MSQRPPSFEAEARLQANLFVPLAPTSNKKSLVLRDPGTTVRYDAGMEPRAPRRRRISISSDGIRPKDEDKDAKFEDIDATLNYSNSKDVTVHFEMDIVEDMAYLLGEFCGLKRIGNFGAAKRYYEDILQSNAHLPYVAIEYADMLFEQGKYDAVCDFSLGSERNPRSEEERSWEDDLNLIQTLASFHYNGISRRVKNRFRRWKGLIHNFLSAQTRLTISQVRSIRYTLQIGRELHLHSDVPQDDIEWVAETSQSVYDRLRCEGRVWEARDIIVASAHLDGSSSVMPISETLDSNTLQKLMKDWEVEKYSETSYLALLEVLSLLSTGSDSIYNSRRNGEKIATAQRCLQYARALAKSIQENSPELMKTRPYIQWMLAEESLRRMLNYSSTSDLTNHLNKFPGLVMSLSPIPIYIPLKCENPGWFTSKDRSPDNGLLVTVLNVAQELQDLRMEALCLGELLCRSSEPSTLFSRLLTPQRHDQKDLLGSQKTTLSKYLLVRDEKSYRDLRDDLNWIRLHNRTPLEWPFIDWCENFVKKVLARFWVPSDSSQDFSNTRVLSSRLPVDVWKARRFMHHEGVDIHRSPNDFVPEYVPFAPEPPSGKRTTVTTSTSDSDISRSDIDEKPHEEENDGQAGNKNNLSYVGASYPNEPQ